MDSTISAMLRVAVPAAALLAGSAQMAAAQEQPRKGGTLTYAYISGPGTLDPYMMGNLVEMEAAHHIYETLVAMDESYNWRPMLAEKVEVSPDAKTFTFTLRKGVTFHNGREMTSEDVLASYQRYAKVSTNTPLLSGVQSFAAPDPHTFVIVLKEPNAVFLDMLKTPTYPVAILPADQKDKPAREAELIGTGPFRMGEWQRDSHLVLRRNDAYAPNTAYAGVDGYAGRKTVHLDAVRFNFVPEANARLSAIQAGDADVISDVPVDLAKRISGRADITAQEVFPYCQHWLVLHSQNAPTSNPQIRRAIQAVADPEEIALAAGQVHRFSPSLLYATSSYYPGDAVAKYYRIASVERAKELLREAGYKGEKLVLLTNSNYGYMRNGLLTLAEQMKAAGMNVEMQVVDWVTNSNHMQRGTGGWNVSTTGFCSQPLLGPQQWKPMIYNFAQIKGDAKLDDAYARFFASPALPDRQLAWREAETQILDQAYFIKVSDMGQMRAFRSKVKGMRPYYLVRFWDVWAAQ